MGKQICFKCFKYEKKKGTIFLTVLGAGEKIKGKRKEKK